MPINILKNLSSPKKRIFLVSLGFLKLISLRNFFIKYHLVKYCEEPCKKTLFYSTDFQTEVDIRLIWRAFKHTLLGPLPGFLIQEIWGRVGEFAFLIRILVMLLGIHLCKVSGPHSENKV